MYSPDTGVSYIYAEKGRAIDATIASTTSNFWSEIIFDEAIIIRLYSQQYTDHYGFDIDFVSYGYPDDSPVEKKICGIDDKEQVRCYDATSVLYTKSKAVCRLITTKSNGTFTCTGWLLGDEGHVMTNNHCIGTDDHATNTRFVFNYEYQNCNGTGTFTPESISGSALIKTHKTLDYTLVKLAKNKSTTYGFLSFSTVDPKKTDRIYIPQHPKGKRKQIAIHDTDADTGLATIHGVGNTRVRYNADTAGGSSGSPVLSYESNHVLVLHNSGSCPNRNGGTKASKIITSLGNLMPRNGVGTNGTPPSDTLNAITGLNTSLNGTNVYLTWNDTNTNEDALKIERKEGNGAFKQLIRLVGQNKTSYEDVTTEVGKTYTYRVRAVISGVANGPYSNTSKITISTNPPSTTITKIEAEIASLQGTASIYNDEVASEGRGVAYLDNQGNGLTFSAVPASTKIEVIYASPNSGKISIYINGIDAGDLTFSSNGAWVGNYSIASVSLRIPEGADLQIRNDGGTDTSMNIDYVNFIQENNTRNEYVLEGIETRITESITIFPNPVVDILHISGSDTDVTYTIYTFNGIAIKRGVGNYIDVAYLSKGIYFMKTDKKVVRFLKK